MTHCSPMSVTKHHRKHTSVFVIDSTIVRFMMRWPTKRKWGSLRSCARTKISLEISARLKGCLLTWASQLPLHTGGAAVKNSSLFGMQMTELNNITVLHTCSPLFLQCVILPYGVTVCYGDRTVSHVFTWVHREHAWRALSIVSALVAHLYLKWQRL